MALKTSAARKRYYKKNRERILRQNKESRIRCHLYDKIKLRLRREHPERFQGRRAKKILLRWVNEFLGGLFVVDQAEIRAVRRVGDGIYREVHK